MLLIAIVLLPLLLAPVAYFMPSDKWRPWLLPAGATGHALLAWTAMLSGPQPTTDWLQFDPMNRLVMAQITFLFTGCFYYAPAYLAMRPGRPNRIFCACALIALGMLSLMVMSHHLGLMWVALEATTLAGGPLISFNRNKRSLEAVWKYLLIGSVGIALALMGSFLLAYASLKGGLASSLLFDDLMAGAPHLSKPWLHAAFIFLFVGYGTKMGLAPMHTWKPDAYGEAPGMVGAMLAGGVTSGSFLAVARFAAILQAAGDAEQARRILVPMGLISMALAGAFLIRQRDFKRLLAYSSVEHMGILIVGIGTGGIAGMGAFLHLLGNGMLKGTMFLCAGNIHRAYGSKSIESVHGAMRHLPVSSALFFTGFLALTGAPPFALFASEFAIARGLFAGGHPIQGLVFLLTLGFIFIGIGKTILAVVQGDGPAPDAGYRDSWRTVGPPAIFLALALLLGLYIPSPISGWMTDAMVYLEGPR